MFAPKKSWMIRILSRFLLGRLGLLSGACAVSFPSRPGFLTRDLGIGVGSFRWNCHCTNLRWSQKCAPTLRCLGRGAERLMFPQSRLHPPPFRHILLATLQPTSQVNWQIAKQNLTTAMGFHGLAGRFSSEGGEMRGVKGSGKVCWEHGGFQTSFRINHFVY